MKETRELHVTGRWRTFGSIADDPPAEFDPRQHAREHLFLVSQPLLAALRTRFLWWKNRRAPA
jgi:hypothetical protein